MWTQSRWDSHGEEMVTDNDTKKPCNWFYLDELGTWHMFPNDHMGEGFLTSKDIEKYYTSNPEGVLQISTSRGINKLDFAEMMLTDVKTGKQRQIKRSHEICLTESSRSRCCLDKGSSMPSRWEVMDPKLPYQIFCLRRETDEYNHVADFIKKEGELDRQIKSICRIQNLDLWEFYCRKKTQLGRIQGTTSVKEMKLFHGTKVSNIHTICTYNFDCRLAGSNGHSYGKGTYFARFASYADKFSFFNSDPVPLFGEAPHGYWGQRTKIMFLARVIVGKSTAGDSTFLKPDHNSAINFHDSCVDNLMYPRIFVIFDPCQIYPEYLIQYY
ncbi:poly [ADP-ribose] polymerase 11-like [Esox lucius]|uniref:Poly [ADP-ribose] polymerase n=1 Tax=Esox lucius TaxID=8010 RepID=C1BWI9_ESOLU|nr:poly [ADP-ribose] polymerase 11-like [Esox lucius]ACO13392.1 Poly polymerase 11 [Esox lucius]